MIFYVSGQLYLLRSISVLDVWLWLGWLILGSSLRLVLVLKVSGLGLGLGSVLVGLGLGFRV